MSSLDALMDRALPLNRKERFYTNTVLPQLLCADNFGHFSLFADLVGADALEVRADLAGTNIQFFPEYGFVESTIGTEAGRFPDCPTTKETPDLVIFVDGPRPRLIAVEAKMYHRPSRADIDAQLAAQRRQLDYVAKHLNVAAGDVHHVALLPQMLAAEVGPLSCPVLTWEAVLAAYAPVAPYYWCEMLRLALDRYTALRSSGSARSRGANAQGKITGNELVARWRAGDREITSMGRNRGLCGPELNEDVASGRWRKQSYEYRTDAFNGRNWFSVSDFVNRVLTAEAITS